MKKLIILSSFIAHSVLYAACNLVLSSSAQASAADFTFFVPKNVLCEDEAGAAVLTLKRALPEGPGGSVAPPAKLILVSGSEHAVYDQVTESHFKDDGVLVEQVTTTEYSTPWFGRPGSVKLKITEYAKYGSFSHSTRCSGGCGSSTVGEAILFQHLIKTQNLKCKYGDL